MGTLGPAETPVPACIVEIFKPLLLLLLKPVDNLGRVKFFSKLFAEGFFFFNGITQRILKHF